MPDDDSQADFRDFHTECRDVFSALFGKARSANEAYFAMSLMPDFGGWEDAGWNVAAEAKRAFDDYLELLNSLPPGRPRNRVALSFYVQLSEAKAFYGMPKNMLWVASGRSYSMWPFHGLVRTHKVTGQKLAPNASAVIQDLMGHAEEIRQPALCSILQRAFDFDIRNGYAHGDYAFFGNDLLLPKRNVGPPRTVPLPEFGKLLNRAIGLFSALWICHDEALQSFNPPRKIWGRLNDQDEELPMIIAANDDGSFSITAGKGLHDQPRVT
jgi:hypothetical protein